MYYQILAYQEAVRKGVKDPNDLGYQLFEGRFDPAWPSAVVQDVLDAPMMRATVDHYTSVLSELRRTLTYNSLTSEGIKNAHQQALKLLDNVQDGGGAERDALRTENVLAQAKIADLENRLAEMTADRDKHKQDIALIRSVLQKVGVS